MIIFCIAHIWNKLSLDVKIMQMQNPLNSIYSRSVLEISSCDRLRSSLATKIKQKTNKTPSSRCCDFECNTTVIPLIPLLLFFSLNTILWSRNAIKILLKTERAVFPGTLFKGWVKRHPNEEWQRYPARGQLPHSPCFSELDKSAQGSSVILCVAVEGDLSFSDKSLVLVNVRFHPRPGIYGNGWHCVCSLPSYTTECKGLHNKTIRCVHAINFYPEDVSRTLDKWWFTESFATVQLQQRYNRCHCSVQQFTVQFIEFTYFKRAAGIWLSLPWASKKWSHCTSK